MIGHWWGLSGGFQVLSGRSRTVSLGEEGILGLENMEMEEVAFPCITFCYNSPCVDLICPHDQMGSSSSLSSSSEWEDLHSDRGEGEVRHEDWRHTGGCPGIGLL